MLKRFLLLLFLFSFIDVYTQENETETSDPVWGGEIEEIVVTVRKREESVDDIPIAITAFQETQIWDRGITELNQLEKYLPNTIQTNFGQGNTTQAVVFIRGTGLQDHIITTDPSVGIYLDGVYLGRNVGANIDLLGIDRIEVARGPQGTVSGRNTLGGAINIVSRRPRGDGTARLDVRAGSLGRLNLNMLGDFTVSDNSFLTVALGQKSRDGIGEAFNIPEPEAEIGEEFQQFGRATLSWSPNDRSEVLFALDISRANQGVTPHEVQIYQEPNFLGLREQDQPVDPDDTYSVNNELMSTENRSRGVSLIWSASLMNLWEFKTTVSYRDMWFDAGLDNEKLEPTLIEFPEYAEADQVAFEVQLRNTFGRGDWVGGLYYFFESGYNDSPFVYRGMADAVAMPIIPRDQFSGLLFIEQDTTSYALFSHLTIEVASSWNAEIGLRYTIDDKTAAGFLHYFPAKAIREKSWSAITGDLSVSYRINEEAQTYFSYARGYQAGGFPPRPFAGPDVFVAFDPTFADSFETGIKYNGDAVSDLNVALFRVNYTDLAVQVSELIADGFLTLTRNAAESLASGLEIEGRVRLLDNLGIEFSLGLIDIEFSKVDQGVQDIRVGDEPSHTPDMTLTISPTVEYRLRNEGKLVARLDWYQRSDMYGEPVNTVNNSMSSLSICHFKLEYESVRGDWSLGGYIRNITDEIYPLAKLDLAPTVLIINSNDRREFGLRFRKDFAIR